MPRGGSRCGPNGGGGSKPRFVRSGVAEFGADGRLHRGRETGREGCVSGSGAEGGAFRGAAMETHAGGWIQNQWYGSDHRAYAVAELQNKNTTKQNKTKKQTKKNKTKQQTKKKTRSAGA